MRELKVTTLLRFYIILSLLHGAKHGYEIIKDIRGKLQGKAGPEQVYPFLRKLEERGYIVSEESSERDRKVYHLTEDGRRFVISLLKRFSELIDIAVEPNLTTCSHCGCKIYKGGYSTKVKGKELSFCCEHCAKSYRSRFSIIHRIVSH
ncbi:MAG: helix-turn-helix transcriptional regulator [Nitrososphaerales archaeon]